MLKTVIKSSNGKTGPISVTYRAGEHETFATCPKTCALNPKAEHGGDLIDVEYMEAVKHAVPDNGIAWLYSHFPAESLPRWEPGQSVFNASCDSIAEAKHAVSLDIPAVFVAPADTAEQWPLNVDGTRFVRCPAELSDNFTCNDCGHGMPLCARASRDYVVVFVAHGTGKAKVGSEDGGGCYAANGHVAMQWHATRKKGKPDDAKAIVDFAKQLPRGSKLRHHIAGDLGFAK